MENNIEGILERLKRRKVRDKKNEKEESVSEKGQEIESEKVSAKHKEIERTEIMNTDKDEIGNRKRKLENEEGRTHRRNQGEISNSEEEWDLRGRSLDRLGLYPIKEKEIWDLYKKMTNHFWLAKEISWEKDKIDMQAIKEWEKKILLHIMGFWLEADSVVIGNLEEEVGKIFKGLENTICYGFQNMIEGIHLEVYSDMVDNLISNEKDKKQVKKGIRGSRALRERAALVEECFKRQEEDVIKIVIFILLEGVSFSVSFIWIYWFKRQGKLPGLVKANEFIARDERMHTELGIINFRRLLEETKGVRKRELKSMVYATFREYHRIEINFYEELFNKVSIKEIKMEECVAFIGQVMSDLLEDMGLERIWKGKNQWSWVNLSLATGKTDFFIRKPTEYIRVAEITEKDCFPEASGMKAAKNKEVNK